MKDKYEGLEQAYQEDTIGRKYKRSIITPRPVRNKDKEGKIMQYNLGKRLNRAQFMNMSDDLRRMYIESLREKYRATDTMIANSLEMSISTFSHQIQRLNMRKTDKYTSKQSDMIGWDEFLKTGGADESAKNKKAYEKTQVTAKTLSFEMDGPVNFTAMKQMILASFPAHESVHISVVVTSKEEQA